MTHRRAFAPLRDEIARRVDIERVRCVGQVVGIEAMEFGRRGGVHAARDGGDNALRLRYDAGITPRTHRRPAFNPADWPSPEAHADFLHGLVA